MPWRQTVRIIYRVGVAVATVIAIARWLLNYYGELDTAKAVFDNRGPLVEMIGAALSSAWIAPTVAVACLSLLLYLDHRPTVERVIGRVRGYGRQAHTWIAGDDNDVDNGGSRKLAGHLDDEERGNRPEPWVAIEVAQPHWDNSFQTIARIATMTFSGHPSHARLVVPSVIITNRSHSVVSLTAKVKVRTETREVIGLVSVSTGADKAAMYGGSLLPHPIKLGAYGDIASGPLAFDVPMDSHETIQSFVIEFIDHLRDPPRSVIVSAPGRYPVAI